MTYPQNRGIGRSLGRASDVGRAGGRDHGPCGYVSVKGVSIQREEGTRPLVIDDALGVGEGLVLVAPGGNSLRLLLLHRRSLRGLAGFLGLCGLDAILGRLSLVLLLALGLFFSLSLFFLFSLNLFFLFSLLVDAVAVGRLLFRCGGRRLPLLYWGPSVFFCS